MRRALKASLGAVCVMAGFALVGTGLAAFATALVSPTGGVGMSVIVASAIGFACFGAAYDLFGGARRGADSERNGIAHSIWAEPEHLRNHNVTEE